MSDTMRRYNEIAARKRERIRVSMDILNGDEAALGSIVAKLGAASKEMLKMADDFEELCTLFLESERKHLEMRKAIVEELRAGTVLVSPQATLRILRMMGENQ